VLRDDTALLHISLVACMVLTRKEAFLTSIPVKFLEIILYNTTFQN